MATVPVDNASSRGRWAEPFRAEGDRPRPAELEADTSVGEADHLRLTSRTWGLIQVAGIMAVAFVLLVLRRPETLTAAEFYADDAALYVRSWQVGLLSLLEPRGGTFLTIERIIALPQPFLPPPLAPLLSNLAALGIAAAVAAFLASGRLSLVAPQPWRRYLLAAAFVFMPMSHELFGTTSHLVWISGAWLLALTIATPSPRWELPLIALAALTGPQVIFVAPLFVARWWMRRDIGPALAVVLACGAIQLVALVAIASGRQIPAGVDVGLAPAVIAMRTFASPLPYALALLGVVLLALADEPWRKRVLTAGVALAFPVAGLVQSHAPTSVYLDMWSAQRYFWLTTAIVAAAVILVRPVRLGPRAAQVVAIAGLVVVFGAWAAIKPFAAAGWASASSCLGGEEACLVPVAPSSYWTIGWDGSGTPWLGGPLTGQP